MALSVVYVVKEIILSLVDPRGPRVGHKGDS
jgi:hypothetical protein